MSHTIVQICSFCHFWTANKLLLHEKQQYEHFVKISWKDMWFQNEGEWMRIIFSYCFWVSHSLKYIPPIPGFAFQELHILISRSQRLADVTGNGGLWMSQWVIRLIERGKNYCVDVRKRSGVFNVLMACMCVCASPPVCLMC